MEKYVVPSGRNANEIDNYIRKMRNNDWLKILMEEVYPPMQAWFLSKKWFFVQNSIESDEKIVFGWKHNWIESWRYKHKKSWGSCARLTCLNNHDSKAVWSWFCSQSGLSGILYSGGLWYDFWGKADAGAELVA